MRISDWSSDVCSSDLAKAAKEPVVTGLRMLSRRQPCRLAAGPEGSERVFFFRQAGCDACQHFSAQTRASYAFGQPISFGQASLFNSLERNLCKRQIGRAHA